MNLIHEIEIIVSSECPIPTNKIHGIKHLRRVAYWAGRFAKLEDVCIKAAIIGGFLHDCARENDFDGNSHAHKSADLARRIITKYWTDVDVDKIYSAIYHHADGFTTSDPLIGCIWDADRITLTRLGITPNPELLSTNGARRFFHLFIKNNLLLLEIKKMESLIVDEIARKGEFFLGIWWGNGSECFLEHLLTLLEKSLCSNLSKLKIVLLYEYYNLSPMHDQSVCFQVHKVTSRFSHMSFDQVFCPLHNKVDVTVFEKIRYSLFFQGTFFQFNSKDCLEDSQIFSINPISRDMHSRFFERYRNTPKFLKVGPLGKLHHCIRKIILSDFYFQKCFGVSASNKNELQILEKFTSSTGILFYFNSAGDYVL